jgi:hypothetical protein
MIDKIGLLRQIEQEAYEIEHHFHNIERWCGAAVGWDGTNEENATDPDRLNPFTMDAGNDTWGTAVCIMGSSDTPILAGMTKYDPHRLLIVAVENAKNAHKKIRLAWGTSYAAAIIAGTFTEFVFIPLSNRAGNIPLEVQTSRLDSGVKMFASLWGFGENTCTIDFIIGIHEYDR